jgi:acetylornithine deacetylase/succinyl-diaminopimelate desuccinylase-like protein
MLNIDKHRAYTFVEALWNDSVMPELQEYIRIPNKSPAFDPDWAEHGYMDAVVKRFERWARSAGVRGLSLEVVRLPGRTPLIYMDIPASGEPANADRVLLYGHLDKQPEMSGWRDGLDPWTPVLEGDRLYGRGGADDGYAMFASLTAIRILQEQSLPHARCVVIIEACEESGSFDLPFYIDALAARIGQPSLVICLDSGCGNYDQLWVTTSLRGLVGGVLEIEVMREGVHSGAASGTVPNCFRVLRQLLARIEDADSGAILPREFHVDIPAHRIAQAQVAAQVIGDVARKFPFCKGVKAVSSDGAELILNTTWRPALAITGMGGLPAIGNAGNVALPMNAAKLSLRLPPRCEGQQASQALKALLERDPPYDAQVRFTPDWAASGWDAPAEQPWLTHALERASQTHFGKPAVYMGEGGTIPFMAMLGEKFPHAQFVITGVLGPQSNAHGPNEFLHIPTAKRLSCCVADVLSAHAQLKSGTN